TAYDLRIRYAPGVLLHHVLDRCVPGHRLGALRALEAPDRCRLRHVIDEKTYQSGNENMMTVSYFLRLGEQGQMQCCPPKMLRRLTRSLLSCQGERCSGKKSSSNYRTG